MFKEVAFVLSAIIGGALLTACEKDRSPRGSLTGRVDTGHGEGEGTIAGEGEGAVGEGEDLVCQDEGLTECPEAGCVNLQDNMEHCGACGTACEKLSAGQEDWIPTCVAGICQCWRNLWRDCGPQCQRIGDDTRCIDGFCANPDPGFIECDARCVGSLEDNAHCGACGNACRANEQCIDGQCGTCPDASEQFCPKRWEGFSCVNVQNDQANCGECENLCPPGSECLSGECGECVRSWRNDQCNGDCVVCSGMANGAEEFDRVCSLTATDPFNCGRCENRCGEDQNCEAGLCVN